MALKKMIREEEVFPHYCKVYSLGEESSFDEEEGEVKEVVYEGCCRDEGNSAMRTYTTDGVLKADHAVQIPGLLKGVTNEFWIDITNDCVSITGRQITSCQPFRYGERVGTTIFYNETKN